MNFDAGISVDRVNVNDTSALVGASARTQVVLASASPARRMLLDAAGVPFTVSASNVDEDALTAHHPHASVSELVGLLAEAKCLNIALGLTPLAPTLVIGCDSMLDVDGIALGKPGTAQNAIARWQQMRGRSAVLRTGHHIALISPGIDEPAVVSEVVSTVVHFEDVDDAEIEAYVATGEPLHVAGAFTLDSLGSAFIRGVEGDHANVVGLSISALRRLTAQLGVRWTDLWYPNA